MRHSELALVLIRLKMNAEPYHVLIRHKKWGDWSLVGGHVEPIEKNDWARAAARECNEELAPLSFGSDFILLPLLDQPLKWGPIPSRSADNEPTMYTAQVFVLRFLKPPAECLARLPADDFGFVRESEIIARKQEALTSRIVNRVNRRSVAWDSTLSLDSLPLKTQSLLA